MLSMKKVVSLMLAVILTLSVLVPAAAADEGKELPIVYVVGQSNTLVYGNGEQAYPLQYDTGAYIKEQAPNVLAELGKALITGNYDSYCDSLYNAFSPLYDDIRLDKNGNVTNDVTAQWTWSMDTLPKKDSDYKIYDYIFRYDWRLDPVEIAVSLDEYIDAVLEVTGAEQVTLVGRCLGSCITSAYLTYYGEKNAVANYIMYVPLANGTKICDALFSGNLALEPDAVDQFASYMLQNRDLIEDDELASFLATLVSFLNIADVLDITADVLERIYAKVSNDLVPRMLLTSYGSCPSYWSMVSDEAYEDAKSYVFSGNEEEYSGLISKLDTYHYEVQVPLKSTLDSLIEENGMNIYVFTKYGANGFPLFEGSDCEADGYVDLESISLGATADTVMTTLSDEYIAEARKGGTDKYISIDNKVDASTCWYPDNTWFIKNIYHDVFPGDMNTFMFIITRTEEQMTVWDNPQYPQYLIFDSETNKVSPLTAENDVNITNWTHDVPTIIIRLFKQLAGLLKRLFSSM